MRYVGHLMKFEDENASFYESAMNAESVNRQHIPAPPINAPYNPFEEFDAANNEFVQ